jgi:hypothetical protein
MNDDDKRGIYIELRSDRDELAHSKAHHRCAGDGLDILLYINNN